MSVAKAPLSRAPRGVLSNKPVFIRLLPDEQRWFEQQALREGRSLSSMGRLLIVKAMEASSASDDRVAPAHPQTTSVAGG